VNKISAAAALQGALAAPGRETYTKVQWVSDADCSNLRLRIFFSGFPWAATAPPWRSFFLSGNCGVDSGASEFCRVLTPPKLVLQPRQPAASNVIPMVKR
jgi:hypothetical protein